MGLKLPDFSAQLEEAEARAAAPSLAPGNYLASVTKVYEHRSDEAKKGNPFPAIGLYIELLVCRDAAAVQNGWNREAGSVELKKYSWIGYYNPAEPGTILPPHQRDDQGRPLIAGIYRDLAALGWESEELDYASLRGRLVLVTVTTRPGTGQYEGNEYPEVKYFRPYLTDPNDPASIAPQLADVSSEQFGADKGPAF